MTAENKPVDANEKELSDLDKDPDFSAYMNIYKGYTDSDYAATAEMFDDSLRDSNMDDVYASMQRRGIKPEDLAESSRQGYQDYICKMATGYVPE